MRRRQRPEVETRRPELPAELRRRLEDVRRRAIRLAFLTGVSLSLAFGAALVGVLLLVVTPLRLPRGAGLAGGIPVAIATAVALLRLVGPLAWRRPTLSRVARFVERRFPELDDRLLSAVEVFEGADPRTYSPALARAAAADAERALERIELRRAVDVRTAWRALRILGVAALFCAAVSIAFPRSLTKLFAGLPERPARAVPQAVPSRPPSNVIRRAPILTDVTLELVPPAYSGLPTRRLADDFDETSALVGTRATVAAVLAGDAEPVVRLAAQGQGPELRMTRDARGISASFAVAHDVEYGIALAPGQTPRRTHRIVALPDEPPSVEIERPGFDMTIADLRPVRVVARASDDFGIQRLELQYRRSANAPWQSQPLRIAPGKQVAAEELWDLSPLEPHPGDVIAYRVVATDNNAVGGPSSTASRTFTIRLAEAEVAEATKRLAETQQAEADTLDQLRKKAEDLGEQLREMTDAAHAPGANQPEQLAKLQEAADQVDKLADQLDRAIGENMQQMAVDKFVTPEMMQKVGEMQQLLQQALNEDMKKALERIGEAMQKVDQQALQRALSEAQFRQEDFLQRLDQTIELLRKAQLEQRLERAARLAEDLVRRQTEIRDEAGKVAAKPAPERTEADRRSTARLEDPEKQAARDAAHLLDEMKSLADDLRKPSAALAERMEKLADQAESEALARNMEDAAQRFREQDAAKGAVSADRALQSLRNLSAGLSQAQADQLNAFRKKLTGAFQRFTRDALDMSRQQEAVMGETDPLAQEDTRQLLGEKEALERVGRDQRALAASAEAMAKQLGDLGRETQAVDPMLERRLDLIGGMAEQAARDIDGASPGDALQRQRRVMASLNQLAADLMQAAQQAATASQSMALEQYLKQLEAMAQQQQSVNDQTAQAVGEQGQQMPGPGSLAQLALDQQVVRRALERLLQQSGSGSGSFQQQLGNVPGQMQDVEEDLKQLKAGRETLKTQGDILRKMLDAQRALQTKSERPERKAVQAKPYEPPPSPPRLTEAQQRALPTPPVVPEGPLPLGFEDLVRRYFDDLARSGTAAGR